MKPYLIFALSLIAILSFVSLAGAEPISIPNPLVHGSFESLLEAIIDYLAFGLAPYVAAIMLIVAGFYFVTAAGDPEKIQKAKKIILWTLIGLLVLFCAKGLVMLLEQVIGIK